MMTRRVNKANANDKSEGLKIRQIWVDLVKAILSQFLSQSLLVYRFTRACHRESVKQFARELGSIPRQGNLREKFGFFCPSFPLLRGSGMARMNLMT
jgi:hypothetical protein